MAMKKSKAYGRHGFEREKEPRPTCGSEREQRLRKVHAQRHTGKRTGKGRTITGLRGAGGEGEIGTSITRKRREVFCGGNLEGEDQITSANGTKKEG